MKEQTDQQLHYNKIGILRQSEIQPQKKQNRTKAQKFLHKIDIFSFVPTPQTYDVSTKKSQFGSICLILLFIIYIIFDFVYFIINNTPKINSYQDSLLREDKFYEPPQMAIGFIYGDALNQTLDDSSYFTISLLQVNVTIGQPSTSKRLTLIDCQNLDWLGQVQFYYKSLKCINKSEIQFKGLLYASPETLYPRFVINLCNYTDISQGCRSLQQIYKMTSGGRIFLFVERKQNKNYAAVQKKKSESDNYGSFYFFNYFLVPLSYNRIMLTFQPTTIYIYPDYLTSLQTDVSFSLINTKEQFQVSNVSIYNTLSLFSVSILLDSNTRTNQVVYSTIIDHISKWGAFWGVLFAILAIFLLGYNRKKFFKSHPDWLTFEQKIEQLQQKKIYTQTKKPSVYLSDESK